MARKLLVAAVGLLVLVLSPFYGCGSEVSYQYGDVEMRAAVEGTWVLEVPATAGAPAGTITFEVTQAAHQARRGGSPSLVREAAACSHRTLVRPAEACVDVSEMPLEVAVIAGLPPTAPTTGRLAANGLRGRFDFGVLDLALGDLEVEAVLTPDGAVETAHVTRTSVTLRRIARR